VCFVSNGVNFLCANKYRFRLHNLHCYLMTLPRQLTEAVKPLTYITETLGSKFGRNAVNQYWEKFWRVNCLYINIYRELLPWGKAGVACIWLFTSNAELKNAWKYTFTFPKYPILWRLRRRVLCEHIRNYHNDVPLTYVYLFVFHFYLNAYKVLVENLEGKARCGRSGVHERLIIRKTILRK
jgi:hypothetical protein